MTSNSFPTEMKDEFIKGASEIDLFRSGPGGENERRLLRHS